MADGNSPGATSPSISSNLTPIRRTDDDHAPSIPSPLNPDAPSRVGRPSGPRTPIVREQREKKDSLKKRENAALVRGGTPDVKPSKEAGGKVSIKDVGPMGGVTTPMRYSLHRPEPSHYNAPRNATFSSHEPNALHAPDGTELKKPNDNVENRKIYRYTHCVADPQFPHKQYYRQSEIPPFNARFSQEDSDRNIHFDPSKMCTITNEKGWRSSRANVFVREGSMYYEIKILRGIPVDEEPGTYGSETTPQPHVRFGWARREAPLDAPVGFDAYSYGISDTKFDTMHRSRPEKLFTGSSLSKKIKASKPGSEQIQTPIHTGDVIGLLITLPPLPLHRKVVAGTYNPAVDFSATPDPYALPPDVIRDRIPVPYRGTMYFETIEYQPTKVVQTYTDRNAGGSNGTASGSARPHPNHEDPQLRTLPGSSIKVWKNGVPAGTAFDNLLAFLPPASSQAGASHASRQNLDDGQLGYYPFVSVFWGAVAEINLGPNLWYPPEGLDLGSSKQADGDVAMSDGEEQSKDELIDVMKPRAIGERYKEQIAEDIVWDLVDEVTFHVQDGGEKYVPTIGAGVASA